MNNPSVLDLESDASWFESFTIPKRKLPSQNIVHRLISRELHGVGYRPKTPNRGRGFYFHIVPDLTIEFILTPTGYLRKFTPDGKRLIAFSKCQTSLQVYEYLGPSGLNQTVIENGYDRLVPSLKSEDDIDFQPRDDIFSEFFVPEQSLQLCHGVEQLNRECSLFSEDGDYIIVASAAPIPDEPHPPMAMLHTNNESVTPNPRQSLENYTFFSIDIQSGILTDKLEFKVDKIILAHNQGIYLLKNTLAIFSIQHQTIYLYKYVNGVFIPDRAIGRTVYEDDPIFLSETLTLDQQEFLRCRQRTPVYRNYRERWINTLKHRFLVFMYQRAVALSEQDGNRYELMKFYKHFDLLESLRIWKMQLLDEQHLLLRYSTEEVVTFRCYEPSYQSSFFVIYNFTTTKVIGVYENVCDKLVNSFEYFIDFYRNTNINVQSLKSEDFRHTFHTTSHSNNIYAKLLHQRLKQTIVGARHGGKTEAKKRVVAPLPISAQSYSASPYLDQSLFSYDEKYVSSMERPKASSEFPIQFFDRETGTRRFELITGLYSSQQNDSYEEERNNPRKLVAFIFHPTDPFVISVQKQHQEYFFNCHIRKGSG